MAMADDQLEHDRHREVAHRNCASSLQDVSPGKSSGESELLVMGHASCTVDAVDRSSSAREGITILKLRESKARNCALYISRTQLDPSVR